MGGKHSTPQYYVPVEGTKKHPKESCIYRNPLCANELIQSPEPSIQTMQDVFKMTAERYKDKGYLGTRKKLPDGQLGPYEFRTYGECFDIAKNLGASILENKFVERVKEYEDFEVQLIGVYAKNREEWILLDQACSLYGMTIVPVYDTLGPEAVEFIFQQSGILTINITANYVESLLKLYQQGKAGKLSNLIIFDPENLSNELREKANTAGLKIFDFWQLVEAGSKLKYDLPKVLPNDIYTFSYTSGTTGIPKAAMITHKNMVSTIGGGINHPNINFTQNSVYLSYLPLAHVLERIVYAVVTYTGAYLGFYNGDVLKLKNDILALRPTIFVSVPRLFNRFHDVIRGNFDKLTGFKKSLVNRALASKIHYLKSEGALNHRVYDNLVFNKVKKEFGGRLELLVSGGAPLSGEVADFLKVCLSCPLVEGYGQTESTGASFASQDESLTGHVGGPLMQTEFKLVNVDEMDYTVDDKDKDGRPQPRGEMVIRGPGIIAGYYKDLEKTREAIDADGWLATGDIVRLDPSNRIYIIDRKKNILKLQIGEYVAPEKIEGVYNRHKLISEAFVYGDSTKNTLVGIFVPDQKNLEQFAQEKGVKGTFQELCQNKELKTHLQKEFDAYGKAEKLYGFELVKAFHLEPKPFIDNNIYTPSFKIKRNVAKAFYLDILNELYQQAEGGK